MNPNDGCPDMCDAEAGFTSIVQLHSGAVIEWHNLVTYRSLGQERGVRLTYDSLRADPRPIVHFGFRNPPTGVNQFLVASLTLRRGDFRLQVATPRNRVSPFEQNLFEHPVRLRDGEHVWRFGAGSVQAALQADLSEEGSGVYQYELRSGFRSLFVSARSNGQTRGYTLAGTMRTSEGQVAHVNGIDSPFGAGWGIAGLQELVANPDGSVLVIDGDGGEIVFDPPLSTGDPYVPPAEEFSVLVESGDGTFQRRMKDGTVWAFNEDNRLASITDRNGNATVYEYDVAGRLTRITDPVGLETTFTYDGSTGLLTSITDPAARVTLFEHDADGNLILVTDPDGSQRTWEYDGRHHMTAEIDKRGFREETFYDFAGRATRAIHKDGTEVLVQPVQTIGLFPPEQTPPTKSVTHLRPDPGNPLVLIPVTVSNVVTRSSISRAPRAGTRADPQSSFADANGNVTSTQLNGAGQFVSRTDGAGPLPSAERDANNLVTKLTDGRGNTTSFTYDERGNLLTVRDSLSGIPGAVVGLFADPLYENPDSSGLQSGVGDVNGDGHLDIVSGAFRFGQTFVNVRLGSGDGTLGANLRQVVSSSFGAFNQLLLADVNGDGRLDLLGKYTGFGRVSVSLGGGDGTFGGALEVATGASPGLATLGDLNGDGILDIVATRGDKTVAVFLGNGDGTFGEAADFSAGEQLRAVAIGDVNNDGNPDLAVSHIDASLVGGRLGVLLGSGDGTFGEPTQFSTTRGTSLALADLNKDNNLDVVVLGEPGFEIGRMSVLFGDGVGAFGGRTDLFAYGGPHSLQILDVNEDKDLDIAFSGSAGDRFVSYHPGNGDGTFGGRVDIQYGPQIGSAFFVDVNEDGVLDILTPLVSKVIQVVLGVGGGQFFSFPRIVVDQINAVALGDLDGDIDLDIIAPNSSVPSLSLFLGNGDGTFVASGDLPAKFNRRDVALADLDGDNDLDIVTVGLIPNELSVYLGAVDGSFGPRIDFDAGSLSSYSLRLGDLNGDGTPDAVVGYSPGGIVAIFLGNGDGTFGSRTEIAVGGHTRGVAIGELNGDGNPDIVAVSLTGNAAYLLVGAGDGTFAEPTRIGFFVQTPTSVDLADLDGDNDLDVVIGGDRIVVVLVNSGTGTFTQRNLGVTNSTLSVGIADFDGDDVLDIIAIDIGNVAYIFPGRGDGTFGAKLLFAVPTKGDLAVGDVNLDEQPDFVVSDPFQGISIHINSPRLGGGTGPGERQFTYDPVFNMVTSTTDELGRRTLYGIDTGDGNTLSETRVVGAEGGGDDVTTLFTYTDKGLTETITDARGIVTDNNYDGLGRLVAVISAKGSPNEGTRRFEYDGAGNLTAEIDENGNRTEFEYDPMNRLTLTRNAQGNVNRNEYDAAGNLIVTTDQLGRTTRSQYDPMGRLIRGIDAQGNNRAFTYDSAGNPASAVGPLGRVSVFRHDARGRPVEAVDPGGGRTKFRYDFDGNVTGITDAEGNRTNFVFDARNRQIREIDPLGNIIQYEYDLVDNLISRNDRNGQTIEFQYDDLDRLVREVSVGTGQTYSTTYDAMGNVTSLSGSMSALAFTYDERNRFTTVDNVGTPNAPRVILRYTYDPAGNVLSVADEINGTPGGTIGYSYDALNRVSRITQSGDGVAGKRVDFVNNPLGRLTSIDRYSDLAGTVPVISSTYTHDTLNRLTSLTHSSGDTTIASYSFAYDPANRITGITDVDGTTGYSYDDLDQLATADHSDADVPDETYAYNAVGNRVTSSLHPTGYTTGLGNRLSSDGTFNYTYDNEGNMVRRTEIATGNIRELEYDYRNRLVAVVDKVGTGAEVRRIEYTYDGLNRRISKSGDGVQGTITHYVYDREDVIREFSGVGGAPNQRYLHGPGIDQVLAQEDAAGNVLWLLSDHLGTARDLVDNAGTPVNHLTYDSYGNLLAQSDPSKATRFLFTGRELDEEIGLYYYRARYYDPQIGRFLSEDPLRFKGGDMNLYRYVGNDPVSFLDPWGLARCRGFLDFAWDRFVTTNNFFTFGVGLPGGFVRGQVVGRVFAGVAAESVVVVAGGFRGRLSHRGKRRRDCFTGGRHSDRFCHRRCDRPGNPRAVRFNSRVSVNPQPRK